MTVAQIMAELEAHGDENIKKILLKHGIKEPFFGVKIEHLKPIQKKIKKDYKLALDLFDTGNADAMYLAGLIADDERMTRDNLNHWVEMAVSTNISEYTVPWVAGGSPLGYELAQEWINNTHEHIAAAGWATLGGWVAIKPNNELDINDLKALMARVASTIHTAQNRVKSAMNGFIIAVGIYVPELTAAARSTANHIGKVDIDTRGTACKIPDVHVYIQKAEDRGIIGRKKKELKC